VPDPLVGLTLPSITTEPYLILVKEINPNPNNPSPKPTTKALMKKNMTVKKKDNNPINLQPNTNLCFLTHFHPYKV
jgi:hypothetical protein